MGKARLVGDKLAWAWLELGEDSELGGRWLGRGESFVCGADADAEL